MSALTKEKLAAELINQLHFEKKEAMQFVKLFYDELVSAFVDGESVHLSGFGNFDVKSKKGRLGRNPQTQEPYPISPRRVVTFHAGKKLKSCLNHD